MASPIRQLCTRWTFFAWRRRWASKRVHREPRRARSRRPRGRRGDCTFGDNIHVVWYVVVVVRLPLVVVVDAVGECREKAGHERKTNKQTRRSPSLVRSLPIKSVMASTIQAAQTASLLSLLTLSPTNTAKKDSRAPSPAPGSTENPSVWKVLVLDDTAKDVLATVLRVQDLRDVGVTLHV